MKAIFQFILSIIGSIFKLKATEAEYKEKVFDAKNTPEYKESVKKQENIKRQDENEALVAAVKGDDDKSKAALEEIRKRLGK
jgi:hypothetical protein